MQRFKIGDFVTFFPPNSGTRLIGRITEDIVAEDDVYWVETEDGTGFYAGTGAEWGDLMPAEPEYAI